MEHRKHGTISCLKEPLGSEHPDVSAADDENARRDVGGCGGRSQRVCSHGGLAHGFLRRVEGAYPSLG